MFQNLFLKPFRLHIAWFRNEPTPLGRWKTIHSSKTIKEIMMYQATLDHQNTEIYSRKEMEKILKQECQKKNETEQ